MNQMNEEMEKWCTLDPRNSEDWVHFREGEKEAVEDSGDREVEGEGGNVGNKKKTGELKKLTKHLFISDI